MRLAKTFDDSKPKPGSLSAGSEIVPALTETREHAQLIAGIDADASVAHAEEDFTRCRDARESGNLATRRREFDRVGQKIDQHLPQRAAVRAEHRKLSFKLRSQRQLRPCGLI